MLVEWQVVGLAIFFALILRPVAVEDNHEVETLLDGKNQSRVYASEHIFNAMIY